MDLLVRLLARLYPSIAVRDEANGSMADEAAVLARRINPRVDLSGQPSVEMVVGLAGARLRAERIIYADRTGGALDCRHVVHRRVGKVTTRSVAGLAACMAAAALFRHVFLEETAWEQDVEFTVPGMEDTAECLAEVVDEAVNIVLAGAGAIGNAAAWALARSELRGTIEIVDHESVDLGNLQRYVLAERNDECERKAELLAGKFVGSLKARAYDSSIASFLQGSATRWRTFC